MLISSSIKITRRRRHGSQKNENSGMSSEVKCDRMKNSLARWECLRMSRGNWVNSVRDQLWEKFGSHVTYSRIIEHSIESTK